MMLLLTLYPANFPQVSHILVKCVFKEFSKIPTIPEAESKKYACMHMFVIINALGVFQDNLLKNDHPIRVTLPSSYTVSST